MSNAPSPPRRASLLVSWGVALAIAALWCASVALPAWHIGESTNKWYDGMTMFLAGLTGQIFVFQSFSSSANLYLAWWSNLAVFAVLVRLVFNNRPGWFASTMPLALAAFAFSVRTFGIPDDHVAVVDAYGAGFWLWIAAMAAPLALFAASALRRRRLRAVQAP